MKNSSMKKSLSFGLVGALALAFVSIVSVASADSTPRLYSITQVTSNSVVLPIKDDRFDDQEVTAIVSIKNEETGNLVERAFRTSLDSDGNGSITVGNLTSGTEYSFKVRIIKPNGNSTDNSSRKYATTL